MTPVGRCCAGLAAALGVLTAVTWNNDGQAGQPTTHLDGAQLFRAKGCSSCHVGPDSTTSSTRYPRLVDASVWAGNRRPGMTAEEYIAQSIREPSAFISPESTGDATMPQLDVSDDEVEALIDYLLDP